MSTDPIHAPSTASEPTRPARAVWVAVAMMALIAAFFLPRARWGQVAGRWPDLLLFACPLVHLSHDHGRHQPFDAPGRMRTWT
ncbi:MAG: DUF2933 domain-containing protein [Polyangiaceae bacterium]|nr:DUF2933 domain-containing protein [Polyangiaceae bacterium]